MKRICSMVVIMAWAFAFVAAPVSAATVMKKKKLPDACALITKADVSTAFAKLDPALQPTSVSDPVRGKSASQGGQGTNSCETAFYLPNSVGGNVLVTTNPVSKQFGCPPKGQPGKKKKISGAKALLEPNPSDAKVVRDVTFPERGACVFIEVFLSGGTAKVPASGFVDLAKAALAKKG